MMTVLYNRGKYGHYIWGPTMLELIKLISGMICTVWRVQVPI